MTGRYEIRNIVSNDKIEDKKLSIIKIIMTDIIHRLITERIALRVEYYSEVIPSYHRSGFSLVVCGLFVEVMDK